MRSNPWLSETLAGAWATKLVNDSRTQLRRVKQDCQSCDRARAQSPHVFCKCVISVEIGPVHYKRASKTLHERSVMRDLEYLRTHPQPLCQGSTMGGMRNGTVAEVHRKSDGIILSKWLSGLSSQGDLYRFGAASNDATYWGTKAMVFGGLGTSVAMIGLCPDLYR